MSLPRLLAIMGSGETAPTMKQPHRDVFNRLASGADRDISAVMLDTPFGFQENAPTLASTAIRYFSDAVGRDVEVAGLTRLHGVDPVAVETGLARVRGADWVFAGPGSPSYALRQWRGTELPALLADKLRDGGAIVFASAAALTLGAKTVPVYELYKVGADPYWEDGLDLLAPLGIDAVVIPHYDNAEGGHHDTRFCYLGERRLSVLEPELGDAYVLGVDEHTGVVIDLDADVATVVGKGGLTLRRQGVSERIETGTEISLDVLRAGRLEAPTGPAATGPSDTGPSDTGESDTGAGPGSGDAPPSGPVADDSLEATVDRVLAEFDTALDDGDADRAVAAMLELDQAVAEWSADTLQSDQTDRARAALRSMIVRLGAAAREGLRDPRDVLGPVVDAALEARRIARAERAFAVSDALRDGLDAAGVEVRDTPDGAEWHLR